MIELIGRRFGRLVVVGEAGSTPGRKRLVMCTCDCGATKRFQANNLRCGKAKSCGCLRTERINAFNFKHGHATGGLSPTYISWLSMHNRCKGHSRLGKIYYQDRGVTVCARWASFESFLADMGERMPGMFLDRIDNSIGYMPSNCRWVTRKQNNRNQTTNRLLTYDGATKPASEWAEIMGFAPYIVFNRLHRGWSVERTLTTPLRIWPKQRAA